MANGRAVERRNAVFSTAIAGHCFGPIRSGLHARLSIGNGIRCHKRIIGQPEKFAALALHIIANPMLNGETVRLDGVIRTVPK